MYNEDAELPVNRLLLSQIEDLAKNSCADHAKVFEYFCQADNVAVCPDCVVFGKHREHKVIQMKELQSLNANLVTQLRAEVESITIGLGRDVKSKEQLSELLTQKTKDSFEDLRKQCRSKLKVSLAGADEKHETVRVANSGQPRAAGARLRETVLRKTGRRVLRFSDHRQ